MAESNEPTLDQLREQAKELGIEGASSMNKEELSKAVGRAARRANTTPKFPRQRLIDEAPEVLGQPSYVVAGALADLKGDGEITVDAAKKAVESFLNREVQEG